MLFSVSSGNLVTILFGVEMYLRCFGGCVLRGSERLSLIPLGCWLSNICIGLGISLCGTSVHCGHGVARFSNCRSIVMDDIGWQEPSEAGR